nr:MAG TPA: hypothetical protein [Caudoviricetes sp.]
MSHGEEVKAMGNLLKRLLSKLLTSELDKRK